MRACLMHRVSRRASCDAAARIRQGDGKLSRKELFNALDQQGALYGRSQEWAAALKAVDANDDNFIEWVEFQRLARAHPELLDVMREASSMRDARQGSFNRKSTRAAVGMRGERADLA